MSSVASILTINSRHTRLFFSKHLHCWEVCRGLQGDTGVENEFMTLKKKQSALGLDLSWT